MTLPAGVISVQFYSTSYFIPTMMFAIMFVCDKDRLCSCTVMCVFSYRLWLKMLIKDMTGSQGSWKSKKSRHKDHFSPFSQNIPLLSLCPPFPTLFLHWDILGQQLSRNNTFFNNCQLKLTNTMGGHRSPEMGRSLFLHGQTFDYEHEVRSIFQVILARNHTLTLHLLI